MKEWRKKEKERNTSKGHWEDLKEKKLWNTEQRQWENRNGPVARPDRPIVALYERRENRAGNWLLSKRGHVTCDPHRMPLTMGERANLQGSYAYTWRDREIHRTQNWEFSDQRINDPLGTRSNIKFSLQRDL